MILDLINKPKLFRLMNEELSNEELELILNKKGGKFVSEEIPFRLINLDDINDDNFYKLISYSIFIKNLQNRMIQDIHLYNTIAIKIKKLMNINDINYFYMYADKLDILDLFSKEFIKENVILIKFIKDINPYIDVIIENKIQLSRKSIESLTNDNLIKLINSNIYNQSAKTLLHWAYSKLIKNDVNYKDIIMKHMIENRTFGGDHSLFYCFNKEELNLLFNSNPTESNYYLIVNRYNNSYDKFNFNNIIVLEYDINKIIDLDKTTVKTNYEYIKNLILLKGCGKSNLKRFIKINKENLTEDIINYALDKIPLFTSVLLDKPLSTIREKKAKPLSLKDLKDLMSTKRQLKRNEENFIKENFNFQLDFINNWEYLNTFSINLIKQKIKELRD